jgi:hypothetical protein
VRLLDFGHGYSEWGSRGVFHEKLTGSLVEQTPRHSRNALIRNVWEDARGDVLREILHDQVYKTSLEARCDAIRSIWLLSIMGGPILAF